MPRRSLRFVVGAIGLIVLAAGLLSLLSLILAVAHAFRGIRQVPKQVYSQKESLFATADYDEILTGCREMLSHPQVYRQNPEWHGLPASDRTHPDPADPSIPSAIRRLKPRDLTIGDDFVMLEFGGGDEHFGLRGYRAGVVGDGSYQLIPGLWYYSDQRTAEPKWAPPQNTHSRKGE